MMAFLASRSKKAKTLPSSDRKKAMIESYTMSTMMGKSVNPIFSLMNAQQAIDKRVAKRQVSTLENVSQVATLDLEKANQNLKTIEEDLETAKTDIDGIDGLTTAHKTLLSGKIDAIKLKINLPQFARQFDIK